MSNKRDIDAILKESRERRAKKAAENQEKAVDVQSAVEESRARRERKAFISSLPSMLESLTSSRKDMYDNYTSRFIDKDGNYIDAYRGDTKDALASFETSKTSLGNEAQAILDSIAKYEEYLDADDVKKIREYLSSYSGDLESMYKTYRTDHEYFSQFADEDAYKGALDNHTYSKKYAEYTYADLQKAKADIEKKLSGNKGDEALNRELYWLQNHDTDAQFIDSMSFDELEQFKKDFDTKSKELKTNVANLRNTKMLLENSGATNDAYYTTVCNDLAAAEDALNKFNQENSSVLYYDDVGAVTIDDVIRDREHDMTFGAIEGNAAHQTAYNNALEAKANIEKLGVKSKEIQEQIRVYENEGHVPDALISELNSVEGAIAKNKKVIEDFNSLGYDFDELEHYNRRKENRANYLSEQQKDSEYATEHPVKATLKSIGTAPASIVELVGNLVDTAQYGYSNVYDDKHINQNATYTGTVGQNINDYVMNKTESEVLSWLASGAYSGITSSAQSAMTALACTTVFGAAGGAVALGIMGTEAAASSYNDAIMNGSTNGEAILTATASGVAEALFEKISLDNLIKIGKMYDTSSLTAFLKSVVLNSGATFTQGLTEGSEEFFTEIANKLADEIINGDHSSYNNAIAKYKKMGYSDADAKEIASKDVLNDILTAMYGGFIGGVGSGAGVSLGQGTRAMGNTVANAIYSNAYYKAKGKNIVTNEGVQDLVDSAQGIRSLRKLADKVAGVKTEDLTDAKGIRKYEKQVGKLYKGVTESQLSKLSSTKATEAEQESFREAVKTELKDAGAKDIDRISDIVCKYVFNNKSLTREESTIFNNINGQNIISRVLKSESFTAETDTDFGQVAEEMKGTRSLADFDVSKAMKRDLLAKTGYTISSDGTTTIDATDDVVDSMVITSLEGDDISLDVKSGDEHHTVVAGELRLNQDYAVIFEGLKNIKRRFGLDEVSANKILTLWEGHNGDSFSFSKAVESGIMYGQYNMRKDFENSPFAKELSEEARELVFEMGREYRQKVTDEKDEIARTKKVNNSSSDVVFEDGVTYENLDDSQKAQVDMARVIANAFGFDLEIFRSPKDADGNSLGENGSYSPSTSKMRLDVDAGTLDGKSLILFTQAHELTHYIRDFAPNEFEAFASFLVKKYSEKDVPLQKLVQDKIDQSIRMVARETKLIKEGKLDKHRHTVLTYDKALEEVVANACEDFLADTNIQQTILQIAEIDKGIAERIKDFIKNLIKRLDAALRGLQGQSAEAAYTRSLDAKDIQDLKNLWVAALAVARDNALEARKRATEETKNTTDEGDVKLSDREYGYWLDKIENISDADALKTRSEITYLRVADSTPNILQKYGALNLPLIIRFDAMYLAQRSSGAFDGHYHNLGKDVMRNLLEYVSNPDAILKTFSINKKGEKVVKLVALVSIPVKSGEALASIEINTLKDKGEGDELYNLVVTFFDYKENYLQNLFVKYGAEIKYKKETLSQDNPKLHKWLGTIEESISNGIIFNPTKNVKSDDGNSTIAGIDYDALSPAKNENGDELFQYRAIQHDVPEYRALLEKYSDMLGTQIDALFEMMDKAFAIIEDNLEILDYAWEENLNEDGTWDDTVDARAFNPVKPNSDKLYKYSLDFSTMCRKRLLQQVIAEELSLALDRAVTKAEGIAIRNELIKLQEEGRQIEIACALCYVESARMKSPEQIQKFLDNAGQMVREFYATKAKGSIAEAEEKARKSLAKKYAAEIKDGMASPTDTITTKSGKVKYIPLSKLSKKVKDEIQKAKRKAKSSYTPSEEEQRIIDIASKLPTTAFTTAEGLKNLAKEYPVIFDAYTSFVRNATHSKGTEKDVWYRVGDVNKIGDDLIAAMNKENGLRSQSWSDFQVIHLLDYVGAIIELSTKQAKMQSYTKVPDYVNLMGLTGQMINLSLIPTRDFNGKLEFDPVEGMAFKVALELREKYPDTVGTISIGITNEQIQMLLASVDIDYVIPYHHSAMSKVVRKEMHIPSWISYQEYQGEKNISSKKDALENAKKYGVQLLSTSDERYHKAPNFSEWFDVEEARQVAQLENLNPTDPKAQKKYGVMYGSYMAMQQAADKYLKLCAERGLVPKFCHKNADFTTEANYWKLLIDRKMINQQTGEIIEQKPVKPIFNESEVLGILNNEVARYEGVKEDFDHATHYVVEKFLNGDMQGDVSKIAKAIGEPVANVTKVAILNPDAQESFHDRDVDIYSRISELQLEVNKLSRYIEEFENSDEFKEEYRKISAAMDESVDKFIELYTRFMDESEYGKLKHKRDILQGELDKLRAERDNAIASEALDKEKSAIAKSGLTEADYFRKQAVKEFGYTPYFYDAGYITPNGKMLNFSGEKGKHFGSRGQDHRAIGIIYETTQGTDALNRFMKDGNIRIMAESPGLDISSLVEPTKEQYSTIRKFIYEYASEGYFSIDFSDKSGKVIGSLEYEERINPTRIINDIKHYYATGEIREQSSVERFLFQDRYYQPTLEDLGIDFKEENEHLRADVERLRELLKLQRTVTHGTVFTPTSVNAAASKLMKLFGMRKGKSELVSMLNEYYSYIAGSKDLMWEDVFERATDIANWIDGQLPVKTERDDYADAVLKEIRSVRISLDDTQKSEVAYAYGSYNAYRKYNMGSITLVNDGINLDAQWQEWAQLYPGTFDADENSANMPIRLAEIIADLKDTHAATEMYDKTDMIRYMAEEIYDSYWSVSTLHTLADKHQKKVSLLKSEHKASMDALKEKHDAELRRTKEHYQEMLKRVRADKDDKLKSYKQTVQEQRKKNVESRTKTATKNKIKRVIQTLASLYNNPTKEKNVKIDFQETVRTALVMSDVLFNTYNAKVSVMDILAGEITTRLSEKEKKNLEKWKSILEKRNGYQQRLEALESSEKFSQKTHDDLLDMIRVCDNKLHALGRKLSDVAERQRAELNDTVVQDAIGELVKAYESLKDSKEGYIKASYNDYVATRLQALKESLDGATAQTMTLTQLDELYQAYKMVLTSVRTANELFVKNKRLSVIDAGEAVMQEVQKVAKITDSKIGMFNELRNFSWQELKPVYAFERIGSETFMDMYREVLRGQGVFARDVAEAQDFFQKMNEIYGYDSWDLKETKDFKLADGRIFTLNLQEIMAIYAYSRREQALDHITDGGFVFEESELFTDKKQKGLKGKIKRQRTTVKAYRLNIGEFQDIISSLTKEQKKFAEEMQDYLTSMGEKGNEVSRVLYGIDLFNEKFYFPLISSDDFITQTNNPAGEVALKNTGMAKATVPHARNPIVLKGFMDVWSDHVNKMSTYHSFVLPIENLNKVFNYTGYATSDDSVSVESILRGAYGEAVNKYIRTFIQDLNGGVKVQGSGSWVMKGISKFKKTAVAASTSVVIQQPTAVVRAMAMIDLKYFAHKTDGMKHKDAWEELKKYAPIAIIKEMGGFDVGGGRQVAEYITAKEYKGIKAKAKGWLEDSTYRDESFMFGASKADEFGWITIWNAVKEELADTTTLKVGSEEFLRACGERFTEVIDYTQVYDSVVSRSGFMRNKGEISKMATSFMGEPTTSFNMLYNAVLQAKRGNMGKGEMTRIIGATISSIILASIAKCLIYALRDDDEDESYVEKYFQSLTNSLMDELFIPNMLPYVRDITSLLSGWEVERTDMAILKDFRDAVDGLDSSDKSLWRKIEDLAGAVAAFGGFPLKNVMRTVREMYNLMANLFDDNTPSADDVGDAIVDTVTGGTSSSDINEALEKGKTDKAKKIINDLVAEKVEDGKTEKEAKASIKASVTGYWKEKYLQAYRDKDNAEMLRIRRILQSTGLYDNVVETCSNWIKGMKDDTTDTTYKKW